MDFMKFWRAVNLVLLARGLPEMLYREAKDAWAEAGGV